jgi:hypothetical protein
MMTYDVDADIGRYMRDRASRVAEGLELPDDELRAKGGLVISPRAAVLLDHFARSHVEVATSSRLRSANEVIELGAEAQSCTRRMLEYIVALEEAVLLGFSAEVWDTPTEAIGLAAATLEQMADTIGAQPNLSEETQRGVETYRYVASRLRVIEYRIRRVPGQDDHAGPVVLPVPVLSLS